MNNESRIPTLLGIFIIAVSLASTVFLFNNAKSFLSRASSDLIPREVKITNLSTVGFAVSWITSVPTSGSVNYGIEKLENIASDDRDLEKGKTGQYLTHHVTLRYLTAGTKYQFEIISGGKAFNYNGEPYLQKTEASVPEINSAPPAYGKVLLPDGAPSADTLVYLNLSSGFTYSTFVKPSGSWLINFSNAQPNSAEEKIVLNLKKESFSEIITTADKLSPVPEIILGKNYDFRQNEEKVKGISTFKLPDSEKTPSLITPASGSAIPNDRPLFSGTGIPGKDIAIEIHSSTTVRGETIVDQAGNWQWSPPAGLPPGEHTVTVKTTDQTGNLLEFVKNFLVLASGSSVVEAATPSASPLLPSPTPTPLIFASPAATSSTAPASGNLTPTIFILLISLTLIILGSGKLLSLDN